MSHSDSVVVRILQAVAAAEGATAREVRQPLYEVVDCEAVGQLVGPGGTDSVCILFEYAGHEVEVTGGGTIYVDGVERSPSPGGPCSRAPRDRSGRRDRSDERNPDHVPDGGDR